MPRALDDHAAPPSAGRGSRPARRGTTLVEVLVVLSIIAILAGVVWRLFYIGHATFDEGIWRNEREQEAKIGFRQMQEDVKSLSGLSATFGTTLVLNKTKHFNFYHSAAAVSDEGAKPGDKVMRFFSCRQPLKAGTGNEKTDQKALIEKVEYEINEKRELIYRKWKGEIDPKEFKDEASIKKIETLDPESLDLEVYERERVLIRDVSAVKLRAFKKGEKLARKQPVVVTVEMKHITRRKQELPPLLKEALLELQVEPSPL